MNNILKNFFLYFGVVVGIILLIGFEYPLFFVYLFELYCILAVVSPLVLSLPYRVYDFWLVKRDNEINKSISDG